MHVWGLPFGESITRIHRRRPSACGWSCTHVRVHHTPRGVYKPWYKHVRAQHTFLSLFVGSEILGNFLDIFLCSTTLLFLSSPVHCPHIYISSSYLTPRKLSYMFERDANNKWHSCVECVELSNRRPNRPD